MAANERRYRPVNSSPYIPRSTSIADVDNKNFLAFPPSPDLRNPYYRRRTANNLPAPRPPHGSPSVARLGFCVSASTNDLSQPFPDKVRSRFPLIKRFTPTRIPSPVPIEKSTPARHVSTPVLPSQQEKKENVHAAQYTRFLSSTSPTYNKPASMLTKSRTMGVLSNFTTFFSSPNLNISNSRQAPGSSTQPTHVITSTSVQIPMSRYTTDTLQINGAMINSYWCGRFQALSDRFHREVLMDSEMLQKHIMIDSSSPCTPASSIRGRYNHKSRTLEEDAQNISPSTMAGKRFVEAQDRRSTRAFLHLQALCTTNEARQSLWNFQLLFARMRDKPNLLPKGGKMTDDHGSWIGRVSRAMAGATNTGSGPRSAIGMGKKKDSMVGIPMT